MKLINKIFILIVAILLCVSLSDIAYARTISAGPLTISYEGDGPIYSQINIAPGKEYVRELAVRNNGVVNHSFALATQNVNGDLADHLFIKPEIAGIEQWSLSIKALSELSSESEVVWRSIAPSETVDVLLKAKFDENVSNLAQGGELSFDFIFGTNEAEPAMITALGQVGLVGESEVSGDEGEVEITGEGTDSEGEGDVLGVTDEGDQGGYNGLYLLIPPLVLIVSSPFVAPGVRNVFFPIVGAVATAVLGYNSSGSLDPNIFWIVLALEVITILTLEYVLAGKVISEVVHEEEVLERKEKKAHREGK